MISFGRSTLLAAMLAIGTVGSAGAADLGGYPSGGLKDYGYQPQMVASNPAFYVRLDAGIATHDKPVMVEDGVADLTETRMGRAWTLGGGIGYYFSRSIRGDLTWDHRFKANVSGYRFDSAVTQALAASATPDCHSEDGSGAGFDQSSCQGTRKVGLKSDVFLANLYYDFDCRCHVTPYLGVGLGFVRHNTTAGTVVNELGVVGDVDSASSTHVAAALMAGFSVKLHERMALDAGYRFLYLGETATGAVKDRQGNVSIANDPTIENIHAHEFRVGLRYDFR